MRVLHDQQKDIQGGIDLDGEVPIENQADDKDGSEGLVKEAGL